MDFATQGFHHVTLVSADAARTRGFYRDLLGLRLVKKTVDFDDPGSYHLYFGDPVGAPGTIVSVVEKPQAGRGRWGNGGVHHFALGVEGEEGLLRWKRRLTDAGVRVSGPYDRGYFTSIYFADPDGQVVEIATAGPGYAIDEAAEELGRELKLPPERIVRGHRDEQSIAALTHPEPVPAITAEMELTGIHHVSGMTHDLDRAGEFLDAALGLRLVKRTVNRDDPDVLHYFWASYDGERVASNSAYTLFGFSPSFRRARAGVGQMHHLAFRARSEEEQLAWREHLLSLRVEVSPVIERNYFRSFFFEAPEGQLLEIATDGPGFLVDEEPAELGRALSLPPWLEPHREAIGGALTPIG